MAPRDLWVDFNDVDDDSRTSSLLRFAAPGSAIEVGEHILIGDDEGNLCEADVVGISGEVVELVLDANTFKRPRRTGSRTVVSA